MKKTNKMIAILAVVAILASLGITAFAANAGGRGNRTGNGQERSQVQNCPLTDEQKADMVAKMKEKLAQDLKDGKITQEEYNQAISDLESGKMPMRQGRGNGPKMSEDEKAKIEAQNEKWNALTDAQKQEVYALCDEQLNGRIKLIDKYVQLGLMDEATAKEMKANIETQRENMKTSGKMPMGMGGFEMRRGPGAQQK